MSCTRTDLASYVVDTNVLAYAVDPRDKQKQARAVECFTRLDAARSGVLTTQVLSELFVVATRRLTPPLSQQQAEQYLRDLIRVWRVLDVTTVAVMEAVRGAQRYGVSYWDGLIWATAKLNGIPNVLTEDIPGAAMIEGVQYVNPFEPSFDPTSLG
jgi:predicted nucleic acid-binding protein